MVSYNDYSAQNTYATGSSHGETAISCRTDAFAGTDIPYVENDWTNINAAANAEAALDGEDGIPGDPYSSTRPAIDINALPCSGITRAEGSGLPNLLEVLHNQNGGVGFADISDIKHDACCNLNDPYGNGQYLATLIGSTVANSATGAFTSPSTSTGASNRSLAGAFLPGAGHADDVGSQRLLGAR